MANKEVSTVGKVDSLSRIDSKFKISKTVDSLQNMIDNVVKDKVTPETVNAACNCVAQLTGVMDMTIKACRFLHDIEDRSKEG